MKNTIFGVGKLNLLVRLFAAVENRTPVISLAHPAVVCDVGECSKVLRALGCSNNSSSNNNNNNNNSNSRRDEKRKGRKKCIVILGKEAFLLSDF